MMHISIQQGAATRGAHNYRPGTHLFHWAERGTICVNTLPRVLTSISTGIEPTTLDYELYHYAINANMLWRFLHASFFTKFRSMMFRYGL